ncbi:progranulin-like isoform X1 [Tachysurus fulvidraco]|uniref:progranulin-like isoform X1 n=1 Tax=Tachysurus fulvidraco TaxID=1234273 RepID=UPI000F50C2E2|nr:progranulin-like isoform X1 [Tachysurus fulvidraco]
MIAVLVLLMVGLVSARIICPDGTECQDKNSCCPIKTGYACCQYPTAVCCPDKAHCCPPDYQCNAETQLCEKRGLPWYKIPFSSQIPAVGEENKAPAPLVKSNNPSVVYCDNFSFCTDGTTCCRTPYGQWSCCPYTVGQCCFDGIHCCPFGHHCDSTSTQCLRGALRFPASQQIAAMQSIAIQIPAEDEGNTAPAPLVKSNNPSVVFCDNFSYCPSGTTCCRFSFRQWTCCVYILGQCCADGIHCCPFLYRCDFTSTRCFAGALSFPASPQIAAMQSNTIQDQCCQSETGCCAIGFHCDEKSKTCVKDFEHLSPLKSMLNLQNQDSVIHCSDKVYCPAGHSCCKSLIGQWACCPYPLGQCCKDGKHCCEYGYDCNSTFTQCKKGVSSIPALLTKEALLR